VLWLDLANAYGLIPHKLAETMLNQQHVPSKIKDLILGFLKLGPGGPLSCRV